MVTLTTDVIIALAVIAIFLVVLLVTLLVRQR